jgi:hypothetical protein
MSQRMKVLLIIGLLALLLVGGGYQLWIKTQFRVLSVVPNATNSKVIPTSTRVITIKFSKPLDTSQTYGSDSLKENSNNIVRDVTAEGDTITIRLDALGENSNYAFKLPDVKSSEGKVLSGLRYTFTARYVAYDKLSKEQQAQQTSQTDSTVQEDPLSKYLPYSTLDYSLVGSNETSDSGKYIFVVSARLYLSAADVKIDKQGAVNRYKKEIADYIRSKNLNPDTYLIRYTISESQ